MAITRREFLKDAGLAGMVASALPINAKGQGIGQTIRTPRAGEIAQPQSITHNLNSGLVPPDGEGAPFIEWLAYAVHMEVPRQENYKWGWDITILELCPEHAPGENGRGKYIITAHNEPYTYPGDHYDPRKSLTTVLDIGPEGMKWQRLDRLSDIVGDPNGEFDDNFIRLYMRAMREIRMIDGGAINNLPRYDNDGNRNRKAQTEVSLLSTQIGLNPDLIADVALNYNGEMWALWHPTFWPKSEPFTIGTGRAIGTGGSGMDRYGIYDGVVYRVEKTDNPDDDGKPEQKRGRILTARVDFADPRERRSANGVITRDDERSFLTANRGGDYQSEFAFAFVREDKGGRPDNRYKVVNFSNDDWARQSTFYRDDLLAHRVVLAPHRR